MKNKNVNLGEGSVGKLLINLAVPAIIAQMVNLLYNIVDRIFIGRMANGEIAMAGIGVAMENAVDDLKAIANEITLSNEEDGIAYTLSKYIKGLES